MRPRTFLITRSVLSVLVLNLSLFAVASAQKSASCGTDVTNLSISVLKYTDATNTTTYNLWPDLTNTNGSPVPYVSGKSRGSTIDGRFQIGNCSYDLTLNLNFSNRFMNWQFPSGSVVGTSVKSSGFNADRVASVPITDGGSNYLNWCATATDNYGLCGVDADGYFVRRAFASALDLSGNSAYGVRFEYSPLDINNVLASGTAYVRVYHTDANTWTLSPEQVQPPPGVTDTWGEWSALLDKSTTPMTITAYQKSPFKMVVRKL